MVIVLVLRQMNGFKADNNACTRGMGGLGVYGAATRCAEFLPLAARVAAVGLNLIRFRFMFLLSSYHDGEGRNAYHQSLICLANVRLFKIACVLMTVV